MDVDTKRKTVWREGGVEKRCSKYLWKLRGSFGVGVLGIKPRTTRCYALLHWSPERGEVMN